MFKIVRTPCSVDGFFRSWAREFHWNHANFFHDEVVAVDLGAPTL